MGKHDLSDKDKIFRDQIGQKATVQRFDLSEAKTERLNQLLIEVGKEAMDLDPALKHFTYLGSCAVHVFTAQTSQIYIPQVRPLAMFHCPQQLANAGIQELDRKAKELYGIATGKLRSGW